MVAGHEVNLKNMEKYSSLLDESVGGEAWIAFLEKMEVSQEGKMAILKATIESAWLDDFFPATEQESSGESAEEEQ